MKSSAKKFTIGRDQKCDVPIADDSVSRLHAELTFLEGDRLSLADRGSSNGTFLLRERKARRIQQEVVTPADRVRFGTIELEVKDLLAAIRQKYPDLTPDGPSASKLVRCGCGAIKPANERCPACGE